MFMKTGIWKFIALFNLFFFFFTPTGGFSQEAGQGGAPSESNDVAQAEDVLPPKRDLFADISYSLLGVTSTNVFLNYVCRLADASFANMTIGSIWENFTEPDWMWEDGDRFHVNQLGHSYLGAAYFASARVNGFNFYQSIPFAAVGAVMWEMIFEPEPSINDVITTTVSGMAFGEMLYRLFLEVDSSPSFGAVIGGFFISPTSSHNKIYNRAHEKGGGNIYDLTLRLGVEKTFAFFPGYENNEESWKYPGGHIGVNVVYGNPFSMQSKKPYDHFELYAGFSMNNASYQAAIISDGYLYSINPEETDKKITSTGLSMHFDIFNASNSFKNNEGVGNVNFSGNSLGWTLKHKYIISQRAHLEIKTHVNALLWGNSVYSGRHGIELWGSAFNSNCAFGAGENVKLSFSLVHKKAGRLDLNVYGAHIFVIPVNERHSKGNVFFAYGSLNYDFPFSEKAGIGVKETFSGLFGFYDLAENVNRRLLSTCLYVWFKF